MPAVLVFTDWFLPGYKAGGPVRSLANLAAHLNGKVDFYIVTRHTDYQSTRPYTTVPPNEWVKRDQNLYVWYIPQNGLSSKRIASFFSHSYDWVYINGMYSYYFSVLPVRYARKANLPHRVAPRGMLSTQAFTAKALKKKLFLGLLRGMGFYGKAHFHATTSEEIPAIRHYTGVPQGRTGLAPNLPRKITQKQQAVEKKAGQLKLVSIARISPEKNTRYMLQRLAEMQGQIIHLDIYGEVYNNTYWNQCQALMANLPEGITAHYHGSVPADEIPQRLQQSHALFMPTTGENFGHSIIEALAAGRPVLISDRTPWRGLKEKNAGWDFPLQQPHKFSEALRQLAAMPQASFQPYCDGAFALAKAFSEDKGLIEKSLRLFL